MMKKLHLIIKISFFAIVIAVSIFLKEKHFTAYISPGAVIDQTDYLIQFNIFSKILLASSLLLLILFYTYYKMSVRLFDITLLDNNIFILLFCILYYNTYYLSFILCI